MVIKMNVEEKIKIELDKIRPYIINDGGNIDFVKFENGTVYIKMVGACAECSLVDYTIKEGIESILINEIPEVTRVEQVND